MAGIFEVVFFFFKQKTAYEIGTGDWSSDVCSSDLDTLVTTMTDGTNGLSIDFCADAATATINGSEYLDRKSVV